MANNSTIKSTLLQCPCGSDKEYGLCCEPYHLHLAVANTAECLMRSRYSAFVLHHFNYLIETHHPDFLLGLTEKQLAEINTQWLGLEIISSKQQAEKAEVTFKAWFIENNKIDAIYECSSFVRQHERWLYTQGQQMTTKLPRRNDPCVCYSGKKFKQCCGKRTG